MCGMVGQVRPGEEVSLDPYTILLGLTLCGIVQGDAIPQVLIPQTIELYLQGRFTIDRLIEYYALEEINKAATDSELGQGDQGRASPQQYLASVASFRGRNDLRGTIAHSIRPLSAKILFR